MKPKSAEPTLATMNDMTQTNDDIRIHPEEMDMKGYEVELETCSSGLKQVGTSGHFTHSDKNRGKKKSELARGEIGDTGLVDVKSKNGVCRSPAVKIAVLDLKLGVDPADATPGGGMSRTAPDSIASSN